MPNTFMQIVDLPAEAVDETTKGWINIKSCSLEMNIEINDFVDSKARQRTTGKLNLGELEVRKQVDRTSPVLYVYSCTGLIIPAININFRREDEKDFYLKYELKDIIIASISTSVDDGEHPDETLKLNYREITWRFRPKIKDDQWGNWVAKSWDRQQGREVEVSSGKKR